MGCACWRWRKPSWRASPPACRWTMPPSARRRESLETLMAITKGALTWECVLAGQGGVKWSSVFGELAKVNFQGPCSVHAEFEPPRNAPHLFLEMVKADILY